MITENKILKIIDEPNGSFTVIPQNKNLLALVERMEKAGKIELKQVYKGYYYYAKPGSEWIKMGEMI